MVNPNELSKGAKTMYELAQKIKRAVIEAGEANSKESEDTFTQFIAFNISQQIAPQVAMLADVGQVAMCHAEGLDAVDKAERLTSAAVMFAMSEIMTPDNFSEAMLQVIGSSEELEACMEIGASMRATTPKEGETIQ